MAAASIRITAPADLIAQAAKALSSLPEVPLYARVDGIARDGAFVLMELELIEPNLFFESLRRSRPSEWAQAIARRLSSMEYRSRRQGSGSLIERNGLFGFSAVHP